jgi:hypothetical protein
MSIIVQPAPNTATYPLAVESAEALKPWTMGAAGADALRATQNAYANYLSGAFASWLVNYQAGRMDEPAPAVPMGKVAQMAADGLSWDLIDGSTPSGPVPSYQKRAEVPTTGFGTNPFGSMSGSRPLMVAQIGGRATQSDGTVWLRIG